MTLTTDKASHTTFILTRFKTGYSTQEVDAFMQEAAATLQAWETGTITGPPDDDRRPSGYGSQPVGAPQPVGIAQQASTPAGVLTSQEVMNAKFSATRFSEGYEQSEVDAFLDRVITTLQAWETDSVPSASDPQTALTSQDVLNKKFSVGKFFEGYEQSEVDAFLDEIMRALRNYEARAGR